MIGKLCSARHGQSLVELALVLPLCLWILLGIIDFGRAYYTYVAATNAAREGARWWVANPGATIAQIQGFAVGGGCAIAAACDLRVATPESAFGVPIARTLGNCVTGAAFSRLVELVGPGHAKEMLFTGRLVPAPEAQAIGMVNRIVPAHAIDREVRELAEKIAANAPLTVRATKEMTRRLMALRRIGSDDARDLVEMCYGSADFREGVAAFLAKRPPRWSGR